MQQVEEIKQQIIKTLKTHGIKKASLFGSIVRGNKPIPDQQNQERDGNNLRMKNTGKET